MNESFRMKGWENERRFWDEMSEEMGKGHSWDKIKL